MMAKVVAVMALFFINVSVLVAGDVQILRNGGFEEGYAGNIASGWNDNSGWADVKVKYSSEKVGAHRGLSQKIECIMFKSGAVQFAQPEVSISQGHKYEIKIWMKGDINSPVEIVLRKHGSPYTTYFSKAFKITGAWQEYSFTGISTVDDPNAFFMVRFTSAGTLWVDDVALRDVGSQASTAPPLVGNLIPNGSFEVGLDRWGVLIREAGSYEYQMPVALIDAKPHVVGNGAKIGQSFLKVDVPKHGHVILTSPYVKVNSGRKYSLSFWAAADKTRYATFGLGSGYFEQGARYDKNIQVGRVWRRYVLSTVLSPTPEDAYYFILDSEGEGQIWIDGVQLEEGDATSFSPRSLAEVGLKKEGNAVLYEVGENIRLAAMLSSQEGGDFAVSVRSIDYYGKTSNLWGGVVTLAPNEHREIAFEHARDHPGYFRLVAEISKKNELLDSSEMAIGIAPKRMAKPGITSPFGSHAWFSDENLNNAKKLGVSWLRMHPPLGTKWFVVEKNKGSFVFYDKPILLAKSMGFNILGSLDTSPRWSSTAPRDLQGQEASGFRAYPPESMEDWGNYVYQTVLHYRGVIDYWEVWNEPDSNGFLKINGPMEQFRKPGVYAELLRVAYKAAKRANPEAVIVGGAGTGQPPSGWVEKLFSHGAYDYMDVLSFHFYTDGRPGDALDTPTGVHVKQLKTLMRKYGKGIEKPIWESESGIMYPETSYQNILEVTPGYRSSGVDATAYVVRNYVHLLASGVSKWFYYSMFSSHRIDRSEATGFFEWDGSPRPLAVAYANLSWLVGNAKYSHTLSLGNAVSGEEFRNGDNVVDVVWAKGWSGDKKITVSLNSPDLYPRSTVYDVMGNILGNSMSKKMINIIAGKEPVYVVFTK